ncbi:MAG: hypothetical protein J7L23_01400 [Candidatus Diapherotrites archaeon]|nr:hypothetical protein [Candidatus Diapherotrites archaeon]
MKKFLMFAIVFLLLCPAAFSAGITQHDIRILVHNDGSAYVEEEYVLKLEQSERDALNATIHSEFSLKDFENFGVKKSIKLKTTGDNVVPSMTKSDIAFITLQYTVPEIAEHIGDRGKKEILAITEEAFIFYDGKTISLPYDPPTDLKILLPMSLQASGEVTPPPYSVTIVETNGDKYREYEWNHKRPFQADKFRVTFERDVTLTSRLSIDVLVQELEDTFIANPVYLAAAIIIVVILIWYRKDIVRLLSEAFAGESVPEEDED